MSKLEKLNRIRLGMIALIVVLIVVMTSTVYVLIKVTPSAKYNAGYSARSIMNYNCLKKGEVCSYEDIMNSIKIRLQVNEKKAYDFYLLKNDDKTATFIMASNLNNDVDWHVENINFRGPTKVYRQLLEETKDWTNMMPIESYKYEDYGLRYYHSKCDTLQAQLEELYYDCRDDVTPSRGYKSLEIVDDGILITMNNPEGTEMLDQVFYQGPVYARLASYEEIYGITPELEYPDWLIDGLNEEEGFWTMSSSTTPTQNYNNGAYALVNREGKPKLIELNVINDSNVKYNKIGLRPVITIEKS